MHDYYILESFVGSYILVYVINIEKNLNYTLMLGNYIPYVDIGK